MNAKFKNGLMKLCGNYTPDALQRIAKSLEITSCMKEKLYPHYVDRFVDYQKIDRVHEHFSCCSEETLAKDRLGHRTGDWSDQVHRGVQELCVSSKINKIYSLIRNSNENIFVIQNFIYFCTQTLYISYIF